MINEINMTREEHIMTCVDPIEFLHRHKKCVVNQREIGADAESFSLALRAACVRTRTSFSSARCATWRRSTPRSRPLRPATSSSPPCTRRTLRRRSTVSSTCFPSSQQQQVRVQLSTALQGIVTQQLLPTADGAGRVCACEVLVPTPAIRNLIREGKTHQIYSAIQRLAGGHGACRRWTPALAALVKHGVISRALAEERSSNPEELRRLMGGGRRHGGVGSRPEHGDKMTTFAWKAVDAMGSQSSGTLDAETRNAVIDQLRQKGLGRPRGQDKQTSKEITLPGMGGVKATDMTIMTRQLATMISSGMTIMRALMIIEAQTQNKVLREALQAISKDVEGGLPLSDSLEKFPRSSRRCTWRWSAPVRPRRARQLAGCALPTCWIRRRTRFAVR